jgi:hypothetical protein
MEGLLGQMSSLERHLVDTHDLVTVRGKGGRPVPILIPQDIQHVLAIITDQKVRELVRISATNPYVFANFGEFVLFETVRTNYMYIFGTVLVNFEVIRVPLILHCIIS